MPILEFNCSQRGEKGRKIKHIFTGYEEGRKFIVPQSRHQLIPEAQPREMVAVERGNKFAIV